MYVYVNMRKFLSNIVSLWFCSYSMNYVQAMSHPVTSIKQQQKWTTKSIKLQKGTVVVCVVMKLQIMGI